MALGAHEVDFRFMALRTRSRRAALALGATQAVGAPTGSPIEVPLPSADGWTVADAPDGVQVDWRDDHPLFVDRTVAVMTAEGDRSGVVTFAGAEAATGSLEARIGVGAAWSSSARSAPA